MEIETKKEIKKGERRGRESLSSKRKETKKNAHDEYAMEIFVA